MSDYEYRKRQRRALSTTVTHQTIADYPKWMYFGKIITPSTLYKNNNGAGFSKKTYFKMHACAVSAQPQGTNWNTT